MKNKVVVAIAAFLMLLMACNPETPVQYHKVNYIGADGNVMETHDVENGKTDIPPQENPKNLGHKFIGWSLSKDGKSIYDFNTPVTSELTLYPVWKIESYKVTFICSEDVVNPPSEITVDHGSTIPPQDVTRTGYELKGWSTKEDGSEPYDLSTPVTGEIVLYPVFEIKKFTVTFVGGNGISSKHDSQTIEYNNTATAQNPTVKDGYTFLGWKEEGSEGYFDFNTKITTDITLHAVCESLKISVSFYDEKGDEILSSSGEYEWGKDNSFPSIDISKGFKLGWKKRGDSTTVYSTSFNLPYSESEYIFDAYITSDLWQIDENGVLTKTKTDGTITSLIIPRSIEGITVTAIGTDAFRGFYNLTNVTFPDSVTTIGDQAFYYCQKLTSVTISNKVTTIGNQAFSGCSDLTSITIPESVETIGRQAFNYCEKLTSVTIPNSVTTIGEGAFMYCKGLTSITIGNGVTTLGENTFWECSSLESITIPDNVTTIGYNAFYGCTSLTSITIGSGITTIDSNAFRNCTSLTHIYINKKDDGSVSVPSGSYTIHWNSTGPTTV